VPYAGFVYKDIPSFRLKTGDVLGFDLGVMNDADVQLQIDLAATASNGSDVPLLPFTTVVTNTQVPTNPRGDTTVGNYELRFRTQAPFTFPGGGLIIRFSNPSAGYAMDNTCTKDLVVAADSTDPSGKFVKRFFTDADGLPPYDNSDGLRIGGFQLTLADVPPNPSKKKRCKRRKHHAASAKKHCKKKR